MRGVVTGLNRGFLTRIAVVAAALVVGPATLAPGTAEAPAPARAALTGSDTAAERYGWRVMQWDFAWEFGESLDSRPYRGVDIDKGRWLDSTDGTGRVVKTGGGVEFHSGAKYAGIEGDDNGTTTLTLADQPAVRGRWELKQKTDRGEANAANYRFLVELVPDDPAARTCRAHNVTIAEFVPGAGSLRIGVSAGNSRWSRSFTGYQQDGNKPYTFAVQITRTRMTWFLNGAVLASTAATAALPTVPMTLRLRLVGDGTREMNKSQVKFDWVRHYDLSKGTVPPRGGSLTKTTNNC